MTGSRSRDFLQDCLGHAKVKREKETRYHDYVRGGGRGRYVCPVSILRESSMKPRVCTCVCLCHVTTVEGSEALKETVGVKGELDLVATRTKKNQVFQLSIFTSLSLSVFLAHDLIGVITRYATHNVPMNCIRTALLFRSEETRWRLRYPPFKVPYTRVLSFIHTRPFRASCHRKIITGTVAQHAFRSTRFPLTILVQCTRSLAHVSRPFASGPLIVRE